MVVNQFQETDCELDKVIILSKTILYDYITSHIIALEVVISPNLPLLKLQTYAISGYKLMVSYILTMHKLYVMHI